MELPASEVPVRPRQLLDEIKITLPEHATGSHRPATVPVEGHRLLTTEWPRLGAAASPDAPERALVADLPEIEDPETTLFEAAINAFHAGEFERAESLFLEEAERNLESAPQRAAISYRQAALAAGQLGNRDASDHWMRLAGREYLRVTEDDRTPLPFIREAAVMAAKCFLSVENLNVASKGLRRAQAIESVIRADDDLMAHADDADQPPPVRPGPVERASGRARPVGAQGLPGRPQAGGYRMIERTPVDRTDSTRASKVQPAGDRTSRERRAPRVVAASGAPVLPRPARGTATHRDAADAADAGWIQRLRQRRPARHPA